MKVLELIVSTNKYQYLIGSAKEFQTMEPSLEKIIDPNLKGTVDYLTYNKNTGGENVGIPVLVPLTYDFGDISYSPTLTVEERKEKIVDGWEAKGFEPEVVMWKDVE